VPLADAARAPRHSRIERNEFMATSGAQSVQRDVADPDLPPSGLVTYDAKDPDTSFARELRTPAWAPNVLVVLIDDAGFGSLRTDRRTRSVAPPLERFRPMTENRGVPGSSPGLASLNPA
jgi:hypothetical protein